MSNSLIRMGLVNAGKANDCWLMPGFGASTSCQNGRWL